MAKNLVRRTFYSDTTWTCPAGVKQVLVRYMQFTVPTLASGDFGATFINQQGVVYSFGSNSQGILGDGTTTNRSSPVVVQMPQNFFAYSTPGVGAFSNLTTGLFYNSGPNGQGQLGNNTTTNRSSPVLATNSCQGFVAKKIGSNGGCAADFNSGQLILWGLNNTGQLGLNNTTNVSNAVNFTNSFWGGTFRTFDMNGISSGNTIGIDRAGNLQGCGFNGFGTVGDNTTTNRSTMTAVQPFTNTKKWLACALSGWSAFAIDADGFLYSWGLNDIGQLGFGDFTNRSTPTLLNVAGVRFKNITGYGSGAGTGSVLAVDTRNNLWCWGANINGQLGLGDTTIRTTPTLNPFFSGNVAQIAAGPSNGYVSDTLGRLWSFGAGSFGGLGNNSTADSSIPVQVVGSATWGSVANPNPEEQNSFLIDVIPGQTYPVIAAATSSRMFGQTIVSRFSVATNFNVGYIVLEYET